MLIVSRKRSDLGVCAFTDWQLVDKPAPMTGAAAFGNATADVPSSLAGVLARYSALPLPSGDAATLDAYLSRLIRHAHPSHSLKKEKICRLGAVHNVFKVSPHFQKERPHERDVL